jgi:hypothetical protein
VIMLRVLLLLCVLAPAVARADLDTDTDDIVTTPATCTAVTTAANTTLMGWIRVLNTPGGSNNACSFDGAIIRDSGRLYGLGLRNATQWCFNSNDGTIDEIVATSTSGWHHLAGRHSGGVLELFIDGVSVATLASGNSLCAPDTFNLADRVNNRVAGAMIFPVALSDGEIEAIAKRRQLGPVRTMPSLDIRFDTCPDGTSGTTFPDQSGNGNTGTGQLGGNGTGLTCRASEFFRREWGPQ